MAAKKRAAAAKQPVRKAVKKAVKCDMCKGVAGGAAINFFFPYANTKAADVLRIAAGLGLIPSERAEQCRDAYREFRRLQHALRLNGAQYARVPPEQVSAQSAAVRDLWAAVFSGSLWKTMPRPVVSRK